MMSLEQSLLTTIPFNLDLQALARQLHIKPQNGQINELEVLVFQAQQIAHPKALVSCADIEAKGDDYVIVGGQQLTSRVLRVNLEPGYRVFPYVATCGEEIATWASSMTDLLLSYWADVISETILRAATAAVAEFVNHTYPPGPFSSMSPGSLEDWPLLQQQPLFDLLGDVHGAIGVRLTESLLMMPVKSVSGIYFPTEVNFASCQLCQRNNCPGRRASYDPELYERKYRLGYKK
jgi:hypothetical protein